MSSSKAGFFEVRDALCSLLCDTTEIPKMVFDGVQRCVEVIRLVDLYHVYGSEEGRFSETGLDKIRASTKNHIRPYVRSKESSLIIMI